MTDILTLLSGPMDREQKLEQALKMARSWMHCVEPRLLDTPNFRRDMEALDAALSAPKAEAVIAERDHYKNGLQILADTFYKDDQHQDYAKHVLATVPIDASSVPKAEAVERVARAWASIDRKLIEFEDERKSGCSLIEEDTGTYEGYMTDAAELLRRSGLLAAFPSKGGTNG
ncbi:MAG: hypothetical protein K5863_22315 [Nitratireductor sp.]|uniref:hypothetical protein n=1 Tax=Nitratireductor sp. TaxID=1872084 RepID=UPI00262045DD|nr:hypothetical protein [Nitratireductor sp.]MCV0352819.1 hypothetical protein [Nitratireductor sp.]